jgi:hypothetical protein
MIEINEREVYTTLPESKRVHRLNTEHYFVRCTKLPADTAENFEEVNIEDVPVEETPEDIDNQ